MRDEAHAQSRVDLPTAQRVAKRAPERASAVRQQSDMEHDVEGKRRRATQVDPGQLAAGGTDHPVHICGIDLMDEAREQSFGIVGMGNAAPPDLHDLVVGPQEPDVAFELRIVADTTVLCQAVPQRRLRQRLQQVHGQDRNLRQVDEVLQPPFGISAVGVEPENDA